MDKLYSVVLLWGCAVALLIYSAWLFQAMTYRRWEHNWRRCRNCLMWHNDSGDIRRFIPIQEVKPNPLWTLCRNCNKNTENQ